MKKLFEWFSNHFLAIGVVTLFVFIPLYPKLPLIHVIRTWVYIRLEDVLVSLVFATFLFKLLHDRQLLKTPLTTSVVVYWLVGLFSLVLSLLFIGPTLLGYFPHLAALHYLRRIEYMGVFFLAFVAMRKERKLFPILLVSLAVTVILIIIYGLGQKFLGFPAYLTMNEEFAKGIPLRLPPTARIPSTFGGHYDLAAYLVLIIPLLGSLVFGMKQLWQKGLFFFLALGSLILLLLTASRVSFGVYLIAISVMLLWNKKRILIVPVIIASIVLLNFVSGASERFYKTFRFSDVIIDLSTGQPIGTLDTLEGSNALVEKVQQPDEENLPKGSGFINIPSGQVATNQGKSIKTVEYFTSSDLATGSGEIATVSGSFLIQKALVYDISITTRFQGQWPKAIAAFERNPFFGSGYSTLSVASDGDYLRMLGETGIFGLVAFIGIFIVAFVLFFKNISKLSSLEKTFVIGVYAGICGLFFNAVLIDVFEASKVAFTLWILLGVALAILTSKNERFPSYIHVLARTLTHPAMTLLYLIILLFIIYRGALWFYFLGDDFTWLRWAAQSTVSDIPKYFSDAQGFFYRPIPKVWYLLLYSVFWLKPTAYHVMSLLLGSIIAISLYFMMVQLHIRRVLAWVFALLFITLSIHHENIFWISGQSSLLAAAMLFGGLAIFNSGSHGEKIISPWKYLLSTLLVFGSMLSYDGMLVAPLIFVILSWFIYSKKNLIILTQLLLIPLYWWMRIHAGAILPTGDYAYKTSTIFVNSLGNGVGYFFASFLGPKVIEQMSIFRSFLRMYGLSVAVVGVVIVIAIALIIWKKRAGMRDYHHPIVLLICSLVALLAYLGLGGMAERYAFIASGFLVLTTAAALDTFLKTQTGNIGKTAVWLVLIGLIYWNWQELQRIDSDWQKASEVSQQTLLTLRKEYFPLSEIKMFTFVNMPIRYGRAWIYPTGLEDALWHMFRLNSYQYTVNQAPSVQEAFKLPLALGSREVLVFEDYRLKKAHREVEVIK